MNIKNLVEEKLRKAPGSPEFKEELACLVQDAVEADDPMLLMGPVSIFHEGMLFNTAYLSDGEFVEFMELMPDVVVDERGYAENIEYLTGNQLYHLVKRYGLLSLTARILEAKEVAFDRLWDLANEHPEASFEKKEAVVLRGLRAINEWDVNALWKSNLSWTLEGQEVTCELSASDMKDLCDYWGVTALVKELIGT